MDTSLVLYASKVIMISHLLFLASCFDQLPHPLSPSRDMLFEEKSRLGSSPPSCHNKCNECNPCMAVQVPTLHGNDPVRPGLTRTNPMVYIDPTIQGNRYSNYKPLGWKCHCRNHFYNP